MDKRKGWEIVKVGDGEYAFEMLKPEDAVVLSMRVVEAFGGVIASMIPLLGVDSEELDIFNIDWSALNLAQAQTSLMTMAAQVDAAKIKPIFDCMMTCIFDTKAGRRCTYDDFNGKILTLYKVMFFALRYNFADFFGGNVED